MGGEKHRSGRRPTEVRSQDGRPGLSVDQGDVEWPPTYGTDTPPMYSAVVVALSFQRVTSRRGDVGAGVEEKVWAVTESLRVAGHLF